MNVQENDPVIEARGLRMRYGSTYVLHGVDLRVRRGEVVRAFESGQHAKAPSGLAEVTA
ncbi:MAG: hypothetical protein ACRDOO_10100 [Actinomadura sp.]